MRNLSLYKTLWILEEKCFRVTQSKKQNCSRQLFFFARSIWNCGIFVEDLTKCVVLSNKSFRHVISEEKIKKNSTNQKIYLKVSTKQKQESKGKEESFCRGSHIMKRNFKQQWSINEQPSLATNLINTYIWHWKSRSWLGTGTNMWRV